MTAYSESYVREDIFMQQARAYGVECGASDPSPAVGGLLQFAASQSQAKSVVEIGTGSGVSGLWLFQGMPRDGVLTSIDTERELSSAARQSFEDAGVPAQRVQRDGGARHRALRLSHCARRRRRPTGATGQPGEGLRQHLCAVGAGSHSTSGR